MKSRLRDILALLMIVVSVNFMLSNTVFVHTHYTPDGRAVSHSHPYLPSGDGSHSHSQHSLDPDTVV